MECLKYTARVRGRMNPALVAGLGYLGIVGRVLWCVSEGHVSM